jgi:hypothetical protein
MVQPVHVLHRQDWIDHCWGRRERAAAATSAQPTSRIRIHVIHQLPEPLCLRSSVPTRTLPADPPAASSAVTSQGPAYSLVLSRYSSHGSGSHSAHFTSVFSTSHWSHSEAFGADPNASFRSASRAVSLGNPTPSPRGPMLRSACSF